MRSPYKEKMGMVQKGRKKVSSPIKKRNKTKEDTRQLLSNCVWLPGRLYIEELLHEGPRIDSMKAKRRKRNKPKQNRERQNGSGKKHPEDISSRHLRLINYGKRSSTSTLALGYILSLILLVTFGHTTEYFSPALAFSAAMHLAIKRCTVYSYQ